MSKTTQDLFDQALGLSSDQRVVLARSLLASLSEEVSEEEADRAWGEEIQRRLTRIESGELQTLPWDEVRERLKAEFGV